MTNYYKSPLGIIEISNEDAKKVDKKLTLALESKEILKLKEREISNALAKLTKEAIDEVIREQFAKEIAARVKEKQEALTKRQNAK